jgi:uncharacterized GH25 family protein
MQGSFGVNPAKLYLRNTQAHLLHGSAPTFEGKTWKEALEKVPCQNVAKDGKNLKITATIVVDGKPFPNPTITKEDLIEPLDKRCFPKH